MNLKNCPRCGKLFMPTIKDICPNCLREIDQEYDKCSKFLRENRGASMNQLHEETDVSIKQIMTFIREGRITVTQMPNLSYPCESCGEAIKAGTICDNCRKRLANEMANSEEDKRRAEELGKQENQMKFKIDDRLRRER